MKKAKHFGLAIAIALVFVLLVSTGINTFYHAPDYDRCWERFQPRVSTCELLDNKTERADCLQQENEENSKQNTEAQACEEANSAIRSVYNRNVFIIMLLAGILAVLAGFYLEVTGVSLGLTYGGLLSIFVGTVIYWSDMQEYLRFFLLLIVLALLIWFGYKKMRK